MKGAKGEGRADAAGEEEEELRRCWASTQSWPGRRGRDAWRRSRRGWVRRQCDPAAAALEEPCDGAERWGSCNRAVGEREAPAPRLVVVSPVLPPPDTSTSAA